MQTADLPRRLTAEAIGTGLLLATVIGSGIMGAKLAGGNTAIALLGNTIPTGAILVVLITMLGPISGAHFNPAVTLVMVLRRELSAGDGVAYVVVQVIAGIVGVIIANLMFDLPAINMSTTVRSGAGQWIGEIVATFGLLTTILLTLRARPEAVPMAVGLFITAAYWFTSSTSFANPAVTVARMFSNTFAGIHPGSIVAFIACQLLGALLAMVVCQWVLSSAREPGRP